MKHIGLFYLAVVAILAWVVNVHFIKIRAWEIKPRASMVMGSWMSTLFLALALTFQVWAVASNLQFHLLLWFFAYITFSTALYFSALSTAYQNHNKWRRWATIFLIVNLIILTYLYLFHVSKITWIPDHNIPKNYAEYWFLITLFLYGVVMGGVPIIQHVRDYENETAIPTQTRYIALIIARISGTAYFLIKIILATVGFFDPTSAVINTLLKLHNLTLGIAGIFWLGMFLPNKFLLQVSSPFIFLRKLVAYKRIRRIPHYFSQIQPDLSPIAVVNKPETIWEIVSNLNFHLYRTVIHVLDIKSNLKGDLEGEDQLNWSKDSYEKARNLHLALQTVQDNSDYWLLIHDYSKVARQLGIS